MHSINISKRFLTILTIFAILISSMEIAEVSYAAVSKEPRLNVKTLYITKASAYKLRVYNTKSSYNTVFTSSNTDVIIIKRAHTKSCMIKPNASGTASVTAIVKDDNGNEISNLKCKVIVSPPAISVKFNKNKLKIHVGDSKKLSAIIKPNISSEQPKYTSDNFKIATVSSTGTVTAISGGQTMIHASIANGKEDYYTVIVTASDSNSDKSSSSESKINSDEKNKLNNSSTNAPDFNLNSNSGSTASPSPTAAPTIVPPQSLPGFSGPYPYYYQGKDKPKYKSEPFIMSNNQEDDTSLQSEEKSI